MKTMFYIVGTPQLKIHHTFFALGSAAVDKVFFYLPYFGDMEMGRTAVPSGF